MKNPNTYAGIEEADREYQERIAFEAQEALDAKEAADAIDYDALAGFIQTPRCSQACCDALAHTAACSGIAEPIAAAINSWLKAVTPNGDRIIEYVDDSWLRTPSVGAQLTARMRGRKRVA
jgi:hypothetical protein